MARIYRQLTKINADIYLGSVAPDVVPDVVREELWSTTTICCCNAGKDTVDVSQGATCSSCEVIPLVQVNTHRVYGRYANDYTRISKLQSRGEALPTSSVQCCDLILKLLKDTLYNAYWIELISVNCCRERELRSTLKTLRSTTRNHNRDMHWMTAIEFAHPQVIPRNSLRRHIGEV